MSDRQSFTDSLFTEELEDTHTVMEINWEHSAQILAGIAFQEQAILLAETRDLIRDVARATLGGAAEVVGRALFDEYGPDLDTALAAVQRLSTSHHGMDCDHTNLAMPFWRAVEREVRTWVRIEAELQGEEDSER